MRTNGPLKLSYWNCYPKLDLFFLGHEENRLITPATLGGAAGKLIGPRYHVWTVPETPTDIWRTIGPLQLCWLLFETRVAASFASIIASQKEVTASMPLHPPAPWLRQVRGARGHRHRSPPPIASRRPRRCSAQAGHTSTAIKPSNFLRLAHYTK